MNKKTLSLLLLLSIGVCLAGARRTGATQKFYQSSSQDHTQQEDLRIKFNREDKDGSGELDKAEFYEVYLPILGDDGTPLEFRQLFIDGIREMIDSNKNGRVSFQELEAFYANFSSLLNNSKAAQHLRSLNKKMVMRVASYLRRNFYIT